MAIKYGPWEIWNGGDCPLEDGERAQVQTQSQTRSRAVISAPMEYWEWDWVSGDGDRGNITAFRRVIKPRPVVCYVMYNAKEGRMQNDMLGERHNRNLALIRLTITGENIKAEWDK